MHIAINGNGHAYGHVLKSLGLTGGPDRNSHTTGHKQDPSTHLGTHHPGGKGLGIHVIMAKFAEQLTSQPEGSTQGTDVATTVISPLDRDRSMSLSSGEIAGTRLGQMLGDGFASIDTDSNGSLSSDELSVFIGSHLTEAVPQDSGAAQQSEPAPEVELAADEVDDGSMVPAEEASFAPPLADPTEGAAPDASQAGPANGLVPEEDAGPGSSTAEQHASSIRLAFETALEVLNSGPPTTSAFEAVSEIYSEVQEILDNELRA